MRHRFPARLDGSMLPITEMPGRDRTRFYLALYTVTFLAALIYLLAVWKGR